MSKSSCDSKNIEIKLSRKRRKRKSSKHNVKQVNNDGSRANSDFVHFSDLDTFSSVRRPKNSGVIWKKKGSSNTSNVGLSAISVSNLNKNVKRYSRKDLLACNNSRLRETSKISPVSKTPFRKKLHDSMHVRFKSNSNKYLPGTVHKWLPKLQPLAEPIAKWFPRIVQIYLWIIDSGCSKHMTGTGALLTNFVEKFLRTVRFGNNDFAVIAGYVDVVIGSMTIKKVYYVEGLGHNLFSVRKFCDKGLKVTFRKSTCFVRNEDGVDLLTGDRSSNLYTIALNEVALNSSTCLLAEAIAIVCFTQNRSIIDKRFDKTPYELINKRKPNIKFFLVFGCRCYLPNDYEDIGKLKAKGDIGVFVGYSKESTAFRIYNKQTRKIHESVNVNFDEIAMQEELDQFARLKVWRLVPRPEGESVIKTKWIFKNKKDESSLVIRNKARLVAVGYSQQEGDKLVCWSSKKQNYVSIFTAESEYVAVSNCSAQVLWMRTQLTDYGYFYDKVPIYCDSKSVIAISCNPVQHTRTKHIDV
nr:integrase, catalytic region, zinc finger, CCHC-type, peptidase aspartic, catalytic [Tanacetum cinerariifolium]